MDANGGGRPGGTLAGRTVLDQVSDSCGEVIVVEHQANQSIGDCIAGGLVVKDEALEATVEALGHLNGAVASREMV
jgi:hypothetical protein